jgi:aconitate hydratase
VCDLAAMRNAMKNLKGNPENINPKIPVHLIIDHSVQIDYFGTKYAFELNTRREFERNRERYILLKWAQNAFSNFTCIPPSKGIIHQINLEYIAKVVWSKKEKGETILYPDTLIGTDSHTTMINSIGVLGWGVGGIEAEACMLGEPINLKIPEVVGVKLKGKLKEGVLATDAVLYITQKLREKGVVGKFVEFFGEGVKNLSVPDRAVISNMSPEYGATCGFFPVDDKTLEFLELTGRRKELIEIVKTYTKEQLLFNDYKTDPVYSDVLEIELREIEHSIAGPSRPQDRISLKDLKEKIDEIFKNFEIKNIESNHKERMESEGGIGERTKITLSKKIEYESGLKHGDVVIAAITSCTNTSNPYLLFAAGLLAKKAIERGLKVKPYVKTSFAPGSQVVKEYMEKSHLISYLEALGFHITAFGCTTCIGNSGPLPENIEREIKDKKLYVASCLSGNRNFEARIHPLVKMNFLMSPPLVVAFAIKGNINFNPYKEPIGYDPNGLAVYLKEIWPSQNEIEEEIKKYLSKKDFVRVYSKITEGDENWKKLKAPSGILFKFDESSTYIKEPPFVKDFKGKEIELKDIRNARCLLYLGDSITTDHISPAGSIPPDSPAGKYLISKGVDVKDFNTYGSRRGNHEVMIRGTFANVRLKNKLVMGKEGGFTIKFPEKKEMTVYDAAMKYKKEGVPLIVIAGKEYGSGSSRDWAAKGTKLLGIKAVIAESFERIHRSNLVQMGILPLEFKKGENASILGIKGDELFDIEGIEDGIEPLKELKVKVKKSGNIIREFKVILRVDTKAEVNYIKYSGILPYVLKTFIEK